MWTGDDQNQKDGCGRYITNMVVIRITKATNITKMVVRPNDKIKMIRIIKGVRRKPVHGHAKTKLEKNGLKSDYKDS